VLKRSITAGAVRVARSPTRATYSSRHPPLTPPACIPGNLTIIDPSERYVELLAENSVDSVPAVLDASRRFARAIIASRSSIIDASLSLRTLRTGGNPRVNQGRELYLRTGCGPASVARAKRPCDGGSPFTRQ
jgi:hypothetical protein